MWSLGVFAFLLAWISVIIQRPIGSLDPLFLFWNALILGILAIPVKLDCQNCGTCNVGPVRRDHGAM